jgi:solute carrier family 25 carnitine/acylcarnitine transporter 20/29
MKAKRSLTPISLSPICSPILLYRMQTQIASAPSTKQLSTLPLLTHILRTEGIASIYKGVGPPLLSLSIVNTCSFTSYSYFRQNIFHGQNGWDINNALSAFPGAPLFGLITTPENFLKTQMQLDNVQSELETTNKSQTTQLQSNDGQKNQIQGTRGKFTSSVHCARTLVSSHGITILYTGHAINTVREAGFVGAYFFFYEGYKEEFRRSLLGLERLMFLGDDNSHNSSFATSVAVPLAGGFAGATAWALTFPLDCVRAGVQGQPIPISPSKVRLQKEGALEILRRLLQTKGLNGLYAGVRPSIIRAFLVSGSRFSAYEGALWLCRRSGLTSIENGANYVN